MGERRIATLAIGYADGYRRALGNRAQVLVHGRRAPVVGVVTMDMTMIDVTEVPCAVGDVVTLIGADGDERIDVADVARMGDLSPYEVLTGLARPAAASLPGDERVTRRAAIIVLDGVGIGEAPDAAAYGDVGSNTLGNLCAGGRRDASAEPGAGRARQHRPTGRCGPARVARRRVGSDGAAVRRQGQHGGPLGDRGRASGDAVSDLSARLSAGCRRRVRAAHRARA